MRGIKSTNSDSSVGPKGLYLYTAYDASEGLLQAKETFPGQYKALRQRPLLCKGLCYTKVFFLLPNDFVKLIGCWGRN